MKEANVVDRDLLVKGRSKIGVACVGRYLISADEACKPTTRLRLEL